MKRPNVMKFAVVIILLLFIAHSLNYVYKLFMNVEHFESDDLDLNLKKSLQSTFEKLSLFDNKKKENMHCMNKEGMHCMNKEGMHCMNKEGMNCMNKI